MAASTLIKTFHRTTYPSISPFLPAHSQRGRTVLITGSGGGIGLATARAFLDAGASRLILVGRRASVLEDAKAILSARIDGSTIILTEPCDIANETDVEELWIKLKKSDFGVDVLILNAATTEEIGSLISPNELTALWHVFETNVLAQLRMAGKFISQGPERNKVLLNVSSSTAHWSPGLPRFTAYGTSKASFASLFQSAADEVVAEKVQMVSYHPGGIFTPGAASHGMDKDSYPWDDEEMPAHFAVWLATKEAVFLHGRFVWANWDVDDLKALKQEVEEDPGFLRIGLRGGDLMDPRTNSAKSSLMVNK